MTLYLVSVLYFYFRYITYNGFQLTLSVAGVLYFFSATINPILYNVMSRKFRQAFRQTMCGRLPQPDPRSTYVSSYSPSRQRNLGYSKMSKCGLAGRFAMEETEQTFAESTA